MPPTRPTPPGANPPVTPDLATMRRVERATKAYEQSARNDPPAARGPRGGPTWLQKAKTGGGGIAAGNSDGSTPGSGTVTFAAWTGTGWSATGGATVTAYNPGTAAVGANKYITLGWVGGVWEVVVEPC